MSERGHLQVDIEGNASGFRQVLNGVKQQASQFSKEVGAGLNQSWGGMGKGIVGGVIGALSFEAVKSSFSAFLDKARGIKDLSEQMNMGTDETQKWSKAVDNLGLSFGGLQTVLASIEQTRGEAMTDRKMRDKYRVMDIEIMGERNTGTSEFAQKVMAAAGKDAAARAAFVALYGKRAEKFIPVGGAYAQAEPDISPESEAAAKRAEKTSHFISNWFDRTVSGVVDGIGTVAEAIRRHDWRGFKIEEERRLATESDKAKPGTTKNTTGVLRMDLAIPEDPLDTQELEANVAKETEGKGKRLEAEERLKEIQRQNMSKGDRRASLQEELANVDAKIKSLAPFLDILNEADKTRLTGYRIQHETLTGELKEKTNPIQLGADGLAKSGLFSGSALNFGMDGDTQREQLSVQRQMLHELQIHRDPHGL